MNFLRILFLATAMLPLNTLFGATVNATFNSASDIPVTAASYTAVGNNISLALNYAPTAGTNLTVVRNTGLPFINGQFTNLPQGQSVNLTHAGKTYRFIANYFGGSGNDLVLEWPFRNVTSWGSNKSGQLGNNTTTSSIPVSVTKSGVLSGKTVVTVAAGYSHSLALCSDGTLVAWGRNYYGQLGNNSFTDSSVPVLVDKSGALSSKTVVAVSVGYYHNLALCSDGEIVAWGSNDYGQLGNDTIGSSSIPVILNQRGVLLGKTVVAVSAGERHSLALCSDGTIAAWGHNFYGQLGNNSFTNSSVPVLVTQSGVLSGKSVVSVSAGYSHSLALCSDGTIAAWGRNDEGRLGNNSTSPSSVPVLVTQSGVLSGKTVVTVAAGYSHSLALCSDGTIAAWGSNTNGQLGNNSTTDSSVPVLVTQSEVLSGITVVAVSAGNPQNLALCSDGNTVTWGSSSKIPVLVPRNGVLSGKTMVAVSVSSGNTNNLALCSDGTIAAWDQYENNSHTDSVPVMATHSGVLSGKTVIAMSAGEGSAGTAHSLVLCSDGTIAAWGRNDYGQFGNNSFTYSIVPVVVDQSGVLSGKTVVAVSAGQFHSLALCSDGTIAAWGRNDKGQLGNKSFTNSSVPVLVDSSGVLSGKTVVAVSAGTSHNLALCSDGTIVAWGANYYGQLGNNRTRTNNSVPVLVTQSGVLSGKNVVTVAAGYDHSLALCSDGTIAAWGRNDYGALGNNSTTDTSVPVLVESSGVISGKTVVAVSAGFLRSLALCSDGTIVAWGSNSFGQLGNNSFTDSRVPVLVDSSGVLSGKAVVSVSAGLYHSIALCSDGTIVAWGANSEGQLGNNSTQHSIVPTLVVQSGVLDGGAAVAMSAGADHNLVLVNYDNLNNNNLANLSLSAGSINPQFNPNTTDYNVDVSYAVSSITVLPSAVAEGFSVIKVNNNLVISGTYSPAIPLELGSNFIKILVTAPNGSSTKTYTIQVTRKPQVTTLESLVPINATLSPAFVPNITNYAISVSNTTTSICVRPTVTDASVSIKVNGINLASGQNSQPISLADGYNTITVAATSRSSAANTTYNIVVTRVTANLPTLSSLSLSSGALSPPFASNILNYTATVSNATSSISVTPIATNTLATVHVNGSRVTSGTASQNIPLIVGSNTITVVGTAEDGTTMTYTLIIQKYLLSLVNDGSTERGTFAMSWSTVDSASLAASPSPGYLFGSWNGAASGSNNPTTVLMDSNKTVGATFVEDTRDPDNDGLTSYQEIIIRLTNPNLADSDNDGVNDGQEVNDTTNPLVADSDSDGLNDGNEKTRGTNPLAADTDGDTYWDSYEVQFSSDPKSASSFPTYTLTLSNNGTTTGGTFAKTGTLAHGTNATVTATPLSGYLFGSWSGAASGSNNPNTVLMNSNKTVGATFVEDSRDPDSDGLTNYQEIIVRLTNPNVSDSDSDGVNDGQEVIDATNPLIADTDGDGLDDGEEKTRSTNPLVTDTDGDGYSDRYEVNNDADPTKDTSFPTYILTLANNGIVTGGTFSKTGTLAHGTNATVTATPSPGYLFGSWTGAASGSNNPNTVLMNSNKTVGATFVQDTRDPDSDGLTNYQEIIIRLTNPNLADTDNDGVRDGQEVTDTTNPLVADTDADGLTDGEEKSRTTNPLLVDTDGDGLGDLQEITITQTNPLLSDTNGNGINDALEDTDNDGILNGREVNQLGTNPLLADTNSNGLSDTYELLFQGKTDPFTPRVGDRVRYDLSQLGYQGTYKLVGTLPKGLTFNATTGILEGKLIGTAGTSKLTIQILNGKTVLRSIPLNIPVLAFPATLAGTWQTLLENQQGQPEGLLTVTITSPGTWSASYDGIGTRTIRKAKGSFDLTAAEEEASWSMTFPASSTLQSGLPAVTMSFEIVGNSALAEGTHPRGTMRGFRLARGTEVPKATKTITMLIDQGEQDGFVIPAGMGWATGSISNRGAVALKGQLGDAQAITTTLSLGATGQALMWLKPYKNLNSYIGGIVSLHGSGVLPASPLHNQESGIWWYRAADAAELGYSTGFAPISPFVGVRSHLLPTSALALSQNLGLTEQVIRGVVFDGGGLPDPNATAKLPEAFGIDASYKMIAAPLPGQLMSPWTGLIASRTGGFTGTLGMVANNQGTLAGNAAVSGVLFPTVGSRVVGAGLVKIPIVGPKGAFRTGAILLGTEEEN